MSDETPVSIDHPPPPVSVPQTGIENVAKLIPYFNNPREHTADTIEKMKESIRAFGFRIPVLVKYGPDGPEVIDGHLRLKAAIEMGMEEVPILDASDMTDDQVQAFRIMVNRSVSWADWDEDKLNAELKLIEASSLSELYSLSALSGFDNLEIQELFDTPTVGLVDEDEVPDEPEEPITHLGDAWQLGDHRLVCGDSTDAETVAHLLGEVVPHLMVTDPPYGVEYDPEWRNKVKRTNGKPFNSMATGVVDNDDCNNWLEAWALFPGDVAYVWHGFQQCPVTAVELEKCGFDLRALIVWAKSSAPISRGHYHHQHETCWYAVRTKGTGHWEGDRKQTTLWQIAKPFKSETGHSTQKPVECMRRPIENNSQLGELVYDPFCGSGTTIIAAELTGRVCYAIELNPAYCDMAVLRWQNFTGKVAQHLPLQNSNG